MNKQVDDLIESSEITQCSNYKYHITECSATSTVEKHQAYKADENVVMANLNDFINTTKLRGNVGMNCVLHIAIQSSFCYGFEQGN